MRNRKKSPGSKLVFGIVLIALGIGLLLGNLGLLPMSDIGHFWPLLLIVLGFARIVVPSTDPEERWGGFWLVIVGLYCLVSTWELFGLHWGNSWPLMIIAVGTMMIVKTVARQVAANGNGDRHE